MPDVPLNGPLLGLPNAPFGTTMPQEQGETAPTGLDKITRSLIDSLLTLPQRALQNSQHSLDTGTYDAGPTLEAATLPMGTGAIAGVPVRAGEAVMGAGPIRAYHGSPHDFDAFDLSKIGTGEGAQAYGHGLYFADAEKVAEQYRNKLSEAGYARVSGGLAPKEEFVHDLMSGGASEMDVLRGFASRYGGSFDDAMAAIDKVKGLNKGHMYEVNINADPEHFLDWDQPLTPEMQAKIQSAAQSIKPNIYERMVGVGRDINKFGLTENIEGKTGESAVGQLKRGLGSDAAASQALNQAGVAGIKYLDAGSRNVGDGPYWNLVRGSDNATVRQITSKDKAEAALAEMHGAAPEHNFRLEGPVDNRSRNYVVFNDQLINILRKYGLAGLIPAGGAVAGASPVPLNGPKL